MNIRVSCSVMGDGPGTGGNGLAGGSDNGGLGLGPGEGRAIDKGVASGVVGMWDGGIGKSSSSRGITLRRSASRDEVAVVVDDMAAILEDEGRGGRGGFVST